MANVSYKQKYLDIRSKLVEASDVAYRLGFEEGVKEGQQQAEQQAQEQQQMMEQQAQEQAAMGGEMPMEGGMPEGGEMPQEMGEEMPQEMGEEEGSELDEHISELEGMVQKGEKPKVSDLRKAVLNLTTLRKSQKSKIKKQVDQVSSEQKSIVDGILKKWEGESKDVTSQLEDAIKTHGIKLED